MKRRRVELRSLILLALLMSTTAAADETSPWTLDRLMQSLSAVEQRQTRFTETRELSLLQQELTSSGSLSFQSPDRLIKQFDPPTGMRYEIDTNRLLIRKPDGAEEVIRLDNAPQLLAYVASLRAVLAGDMVQLQRYFNLSLDGNRKAWRLRLKPMDAALARQLREIEISGSYDRIGHFLVLEQGGDRTITRILNLDAE